MPQLNPILLNPSLTLRPPCWPWLSQACIVAERVVPTHKASLMEALKSALSRALGGADRTLLFVTLIPMLSTPDERLLVGVGAGQRRVLHVCLE